MTDKREFELKDVERNVAVGSLRVEHLNIVENPSFLDYLKGGWGISLCVDIDFTASNIDPSNP
jgi:hypothetical protein